MRTIVGSVLLCLWGTAGCSIFDAAPASEESIGSFLISVGAASSQQVVDHLELSAFEQEDLISKGTYECLAALLCSADTIFGIQKRFVNHPEVVSADELRSAWMELTRVGKAQKVFNEEFLGVLESIRGARISGLRHV